LKEGLPCFTPSGTFANRRSDGLISHSGLLSFDIDANDNPGLDAQSAPEVRDAIGKFSNVGYCALSASGAGVWGVVLIEEPARHTEYFDALKADFLKWGVVIDRACRDVSRLRYWSHDPDAIIKPDARPYQLRPKDEVYTFEPYRPKYTTQANDEADRMEAIITQIESAHADITGDYQTWFSLACSIASQFGEAGRDYWHRISQYGPTYQQGEADRQYNHVLKMPRNGYTLGTFYRQAEAHGFTFKGNVFSTTKQVQPKAGRYERGILINEYGYPAEWDISTDAAQMISSNPLISEMITMFELEKPEYTKLN
jgi:hypothetical protein